MSVCIIFQLQIFNWTESTLALLGFAMPDTMPEFFSAPTASKEELMMLTVSEIIAELIRAHEDGKDINLNRYCISM